MSCTRHMPRLLRHKGAAVQVRSGRHAKGSFNALEAPHPPGSEARACAPILLRPRDPAVIIFFMLRWEWEFAMRRIIQANIDRLKELLKTETDPTKRTMETRLLAEEEAELKQLPEYDKKETTRIMRQRRYLEL